MMSFFNYNNKTIKLSANENNLYIETNFIHQAGRTSSLLLSNQGIVYGWGLWGEGSNVSLSKKLISPTNICKDILIDEDDYFVNIFSGEQHCFLLTEKGRVFGMGSGEKARECSKITLRLVKQMLSAGFNGEETVKLINSRMNLAQNKEMYSSLDISILDLCFLTLFCSFINLLYIANTIKLITIITNNII